MARDGRINIRLSSELKARMQEYCERRHTSISELVVRFFVRLLEEEEKRKDIDADQI
jgi:Arc/MetJ-type ribon-helix-helix transcriptional regulator